ncbi:histidinol-phosphate transaminase [Halobacillus sp. Marseille-Q1614]|uniref:histidinol-phosphate transaminase n=1 Tax=Halobacillus sp. Marseille-Q1614 TaxID=2709134 RepID=UPI00156E54F6|nr:histidinol-phosphate transaminase [Halobacillus sp. Marseille-Q1614]
MISPRPQLNGISMYSPGKPIEELKREKGLTKILKMASNENPFGYSSLVDQAVQKEMTELTRYPETTSPALGVKLANRLDVKPDQLIFGNGSDEIIRLLTRSYINEGDEVVMASVTFPRYKTNVLIEGGEPVEVEMVDGTHDLTSMLREITHKTKLVFVCNPNNPTGTIVKEEQLERFIEQVPPHVLLVIDEAYYEYVDSDEYLETLPLLEKYPNMIILRTFSKIYGLAALRIGYGLMAPEIVQELLKVKDPFNVNRLAAAAASASLDDDEFLHNTILKNQEGRTQLIKGFKEMGLSYFPTQTNFIMVDVGRPADEVFEGLLDKGVIVRPGHLMGYHSMLRVTIGLKEENEVFLDGLKAILHPRVSQSTE